ncbi:MAG: insulinase family protein [Chitinophagaceae bacterium]|nr:insulinase family protein [Chitinophagaceae bacterium]
MRRFSVILGFLTILPVAVLSQIKLKLTDRIPADPDVKIGRLANGLTYYIRKNKMPEKKLELRLVVNAGSVLENENQLGLAHFMEHMGFNGSKNFPKNELVDYLQKAGVEFGADLNAYTSFDETVYILPVPTENPETVDKAFLVLEDWAFNNLFDSLEIEKERGVVLEELRLSKGSRERMLRKYFPKLMNGSRYANRLPIGTEEVLKNFRHHTLKNFYKNWYRPNLMAVMVVGDIEPAEAEKKIIRHFSKYKNPANAPSRPQLIPIPGRTKPEAMVVTDEEATFTVLQIFNYIKPARKTQTWAQYREDIKEELLSALINQRLRELTEKEKPPFVQAGTGYQPLVRGYSTFASYAVLGESPLQDAMDALLGEIRRAKEFGFLASELERAKANLMKNAENELNEKDKTESSEIISSYIDHFLSGTPIPGPVNRFRFLQQILPGITLQEINKMAKAMPSPASAFALLTAPEKRKTEFPSDADFLKLLMAANKKPVQPYQEKSLAASLLDKEPLPGKIMEKILNEKLGTYDYTLSNGVTVTLKPTRFKNDEILMDAWREGGFHRFDISDKENAQYCAQIIQNMGVKDMSPTDLKKFLSGKNISVTPYINQHEEGIEGKSSVKDFETFLQLMHLYFTGPRSDEALFKSYVSKSKAQYQFARMSPFAWFSDTVLKIAYKGNPWASAIPSPEEFDKIQLGKVMMIYQTIWGNAHGLHFTFVGNLDVGQTEKLLEKYVASLPAAPANITSKDNGARLLSGSHEAILKKGKEKQSLVLFSWEGAAPFLPEERLKLNALTEILNIKITERLREEMSGIYSAGITGSLEKRPYEHYTVSAFIPCGPENVEKLSDALFALIRELQTKGPEQKDLDKVKETFKNQYKVNLQDNDWWLTNLANARINKINPELLLSFEERVNALTTDDIKNAAVKYLSGPDIFKAALYPESATVETGLKPMKKGF